MTRPITMRTTSTELAAQVQLEDFPPLRYCEQNLLQQTSPLTLSAQIELTLLD